MHSKIYLPATIKLKYTRTYAVYSTLKPKSMFYHGHLGGFSFAFSLIHQLSSYRVNKGSYLMMGPGILLPLPC